MDLFQNPAWEMFVQSKPSLVYPDRQAQKGDLMYVKALIKENSSPLEDIKLLVL